MAAPAPGPDKSFIDLGIVTIDGKQFKAKLVYKDSTGRQVQDITHLNDAILPPEKRIAIKDLVQTKLGELNTALEVEGKTLKDRASIEITRDKIEATGLGPEKETFRQIGPDRVTEIFHETFNELNTLYETTPRATTAPAAQAQPPAPLGAGEALEINATIAQASPLQEAQRALAEQLRRNPGRRLEAAEVKDYFDNVYRALNPGAEGADGGEGAAAEPAIEFNLDTGADFMAACLGLKAKKERQNHTFSRLDNMVDLQTAMQNEHNRQLLKEYMSDKINAAQRAEMDPKFMRAQRALGDESLIGRTLTFTG